MPLSKLVLRLRFSPSLSLSLFLAYLPRRGWSGQQFNVVSRESQCGVGDRGGE